MGCGGSKKLLASVQGKYHESDLPGLKAEFKRYSVAEKGKAMDKVGLVRALHLDSSVAVGPLGTRLFNAFAPPVAAGKPPKETIGFADYVRGLAVTCRGSMLEKWKFVFMLFDSDRDGKLSDAELRHTFGDFCLAGLRANLMGSPTSPAAAATPEQELAHQSFVHGLLGSPDTNVTKVEDNTVTKAAVDELVAIVHAIAADTLRRRGKPLPAGASPEISLEVFVTAMVRMSEDAHVEIGWVKEDEERKKQIAKEKAAAARSAAARNKTGKTAQAPDKHRGVGRHGGRGTAAGGDRGSAAGGAGGAPDAAGAGAGGGGGGGTAAEAEGKAAHEPSGASANGGGAHGHDRRDGHRTRGAVADRRGPTRATEASAPSTLRGSETDTGTDTGTGTANVPHARGSHAGHARQREPGARPGSELGARPGGTRDSASGGAVSR